MNGDSEPPAFKWVEREPPFKVELLDEALFVIHRPRRTQCLVKPKPGKE